MKYYIIAGEASGDLHASNLMASISELDREAEFRCWGGDRMQARGGVLVRHYRDLDYMGFVEVLQNIRSILRLISLCKKDLLACRPDVLILIDYPGFNLRMSKFASKHGIRTVYYISPQVWAWQQSRVKTIRRYVDKMLVILPFEQEFYKKLGVNVTFTGHPLLDAIDSGNALTDPETFRKQHNLPDKPLVAILPGSRQLEIRNMLPVMAAAARNFPAHHFVIAGLSTHPKSVYESAADISGTSLLFGQTYSLLRHSAAAMVTSGTATMETALLGVPQVVCYNVSAITYFMARRVAKVSYISLVNLIMDKPVVRELIQHHLTAKTLALEMEKLLFDNAYRQQIHLGYQELRMKLGGGGASKRAARAILNEITGEKDEQEPPT